MEDSHIANVTDLGNGCSFFGVFDGHGGKTISFVLKPYLFIIGQEVALYVKKHFVKELSKLSAFKSKDYKTALEEAFFKMDEMMKT